MSGQALAADHLLRTHKCVCACKNDACGPKHQPPGFSRHGRRRRGRRRIGLQRRRALDQPGCGQRPAVARAGHHRLGELAAGHRRVGDPPPRRRRRDHGVRGQRERGPGRAVPALRVHDGGPVPGERLPDRLVPGARRPRGLAVADGQGRGAGRGQGLVRHQHRLDRLGPGARGPHRRLAARRLPAQAQRRQRRAAVRSGHGQVAVVRGEGRAQVLRADLAGVQHVGRLRPLQGRGRQLRQPLPGGQPRPPVRPQRRRHVPHLRAERDQAGRVPGP